MYLRVFVIPKKSAYRCSYQLSVISHSIAGVRISRWTQKPICGSFRMTKQRLKSLADCENDTWSINKQLEFVTITTSNIALAYQ